MSLVLLRIIYKYYILKYTGYKDKMYLQLDWYFMKTADAIIDANITEKNTAKQSQKRGGITDLSTNC